MPLRLALLFQHGNFVGREYAAALAAAGRSALLIAAGSFSEASRTREEQRTGGLWQPPPLPAWPQHRFAALEDPALWALLREAGTDLAIQGGVGLLTPAMIAVPRLGILNVHPGRLPDYRGSACPEWALLNGDPVVATAHLVDAGLDTGPVVCARPYPVAPGTPYVRIRAGLYAHCAATLLEAIDLLERHGAGIAVPQPAGGRRWPPLPAEKLAMLLAR